MASEIVKYALDNGQDIQVTESDVRDLLAASGQMADNVTAQEIKTFMRLCQAHRLNPFTRDAYIVKYGSAPATIITGKEAFTKRAFRNKRFRGYRAGITLVGTDGKLHRREGSMLMPGEELMGGWCKVFIEGYEEPMYDEVSLAEYSTGKGNWSRQGGKPSTMIRKVAITHALREAFPEDLGGLYEAAEMDSSCDAQEVPYEVEDVMDEPEPAEDPRKALWEDVAALKQAALELGTAEEGITSWMQANIKNGDGSAKAPNEYSAEDVARLRGFLEDNIADHEQMAAERTEQLELADHDIEF